MQYQIVPVTPYQQNCSIIWCEETHEAAIVDPGGDVELIIKTITQLKVKVTKVLLTHGHFDHVGGAEQIAQHYQVAIIGPQQEDQFLLDMLQDETHNYGFPVSAAFIPDQWLTGGETITLGTEKIHVLYCPGHTPGHVVFFCPSIKLALVGDVLFSGSVGRTDFYRSDFDTLVNSILTQLWPLGDDVQFIPGHGPMSTIGRERKTNPFVGEGALT